MLVCRLFVAFRGCFCRYLWWASCTSVCGWVAGLAFGFGSGVSFLWGGFVFECFGYCGTCWLGFAGSFCFAWV